MKSEGQGNFLSQVQGFTPVIDVLAKEMGLMTAVVYGVVWRYCQQKNGVCTAALETIAEHIDVNRKTVERHIKKLCEHGYLEDLTPKARNRPHVYADTGKAKIFGLLEVRVDSGQTESPTKPDRESQPGQTESPTKPDREHRPGQTESPTRSDRESHPGKTESPTGQTESLSGSDRESYWSDRKSHEETRYY